MSFVKRIVFLQFLLFGYTCVFAQNIHLHTRFSKISSLNSLPNNLVSDIILDTDGFYWFASDNGLSRFDGTRIVTYKHEINNPNSLPHNLLFGLTLDSQGNLWIATSFGIARYNKIENNFECINPKNNSEIPNAYITHISSFGSDVWFTTPSYVCKLDIISKKISKFPVPVGRTPQNKDPYIHAMDIDSQGILWISTDDSFYSFNPKTQKFIEVLQFSNINTDNPNQIINSIFSHNQKIWLGTILGDIYVYNSANKSITNISTQKLGKKIGVNGFFKDYTNAIYVLLDKKGIGYINQKLNAVEVIPNSYFSIVENCNLLCAYEDANKNIWFGHKNKGVSYISSNKTFNLINSDYEQGKYLRSNTVSAVLYDKNKTLWLGTDGGGLYKNNGIHNSYFLPVAQVTAESILSIYQDKQGFVWIGTYRDGIFVLSPDGSVVKRFVKEKNKGLGSNDIRCITEDKQGIMWFATHGAGVSSYNTKNNIFTNYNSTNIGLSGDWTYDILCSSNNSIWVGTNYGLNCINPQRNSCKVFLSDSKKKSLINNNVYSLYEDNVNNIWCGTQEGLSIINSKTLKFTNVFGSKEIVVNSISQDAADNMWLGTNIGLYKVNSYGKVLQYFNKNSQLESDFFLRSSKSLHSQGLFFLGTTNGIVFFNPNQIQKNISHSNVLFTDIKINNISIFNNENLAFTLNVDSILELPYYKNSISFFFADMQWHNPYLGELYYQMLGIDTAAVVCNKDRQVSYANLKPGTYVFSIGYMQDGKFKSYKSLECVILQPWWLRWWAIVLYIIVFIVVMRLFYVYVKTTTTAQNKLMIEQNKTKNMEELYEAKIRFFTNISHDIRNPLTLIANPVNNLLAKNDLDAESRTLLTIMKRNTNQLLQLVNELLEFRKIESGMVQLSLQPSNLVTIAQQIIDDFTNQAFQKNIEVSCISESPCIIAQVEPRYFEKALYNLLSNAFKFTPENGKIQVALRIHKQKKWHKYIFKGSANTEFVTIEVRDSGKGVPADKIDKIFDRFYEGENVSGVESSGIGLSIVKSIIEQHKGTITVENKNGAVFTIMLPIDSNIQVTTDNFETTHQTDTIESTERVYTKELKSQTVLIVEDNQDLRAYLQMLLSKHYTVIEASNGKEGFEMAISLSPDLIVSDVMMPQMNGIDLCIHIKKSLETSHIPVILLTAKTLEEAQKEGLQAGADDYITKPFVDDVLLLKITNILRTREQLCARFTVENKDISQIASTSADSKFMTKFMKAIEEGYADSEFSIEVIADKIGLSRSQVYKKSIALTAKTPVDIIQEVRIQNALNLLKNTTLSISEIAYSVGYSDPRYFSARFKKMVGVIPSEFRDKID